MRIWGHLGGPSSPSKPHSGQLREAEDDLSTAKDPLRLGRHSKACFFSQQAAEKALKAPLLREAGSLEITLCMVRLLEAASEQGIEVPDELFRNAGALDKAGSQYGRYGSRLAAWLPPSGAHLHRPCPGLAGPAHLHSSPLIASPGSGVARVEGVTELKLRRSLSAGWPNSPRDGGLVAEGGIGPRRSVVLAVTAISTALVCVATMMFVLYVPATRGYFNLGETMVFTTAILFGPYVGAIAGGVGSALADVLLGFSIYAPATLVIKGVEGFVVGFLTRRGARASKTSMRYMAVVGSVLTGSLIGSVGAHYYSGDVDITIGPGEHAVIEVSAYVPVSLWVFIGVSIAVLIMALSAYLEPEVGWAVLSILAGGSLMVLGYFTYQAFLLGVMAALVEVPINIGQVSIGLAVAIPLTRALRKRLPITLWRR